MTSDVTLTAALRNNLLSLKDAGKSDAERVTEASSALTQAQESTESQQDSLATSALNGRASALTGILDGLSDSIQTLKNADQATGKISGLLNAASNILKNLDENGETEALVQQYNDTLAQIDAVAASDEAGFRGTNLLNGDELETVFNKEPKSSLVTQGRILQSKSLGLSQLDFPGSPIESAISQIRAAQTDVQEFGTALGNDLSALQTRREFTQNLIGTLTEGANRLSVNSQSAEGATLLALNTRQQLEGSELSLASGSQESILRLF